MRKGFTLIELLVVIAIIAILASFLFPVFLKAKQNAYMTKCLAHGRQLGQAMVMYLDDNNDRFPSKATQAMLDVFAGWTWTYDWPNAPGVETWRVGGLNEFVYIQLASYAKSKDLWICPSPSGAYGTKYAYGYKCSWFFIRGKIGYGQDRTTYPDTPFQDETTGVGRAASDVLGEDRAKYGRPGVSSKKVFAFCYSLGPDIPVEAYGGGPVITPYYPHNEGSIYVYLDGHAKWHETGCGWAPVGYTKHRMDRQH